MNTVQTKTIRLFDEDGDEFGELILPLGVAPFHGGDIFCIPDPDVEEYVVYDELYDEDYNLVELHARPYTDDDEHEVFLLSRMGV